MAKLGDFGTRHDEPQQSDVEVEPVTFGWFGVDIRIATRYNQVKLMNLMDSARVVDKDDPMAMVVIKDTLKVIIHPADFHTFWQLAEQEEQDIQDLAVVIDAVFQGLTDRPTQPLSDSSGGQRTTDTSLPVDSDTPASLGRPDLELLRRGGRESRARIAAQMTGLG